MIAPSAVALILATAGVASAGGYVGLGVGSDASINGDMSKHFDADGQSAGKLFLGQRLGSFAIEASFFGTDMNAISGRAQAVGGSQQFSTKSLGIDVKYHVGLMGPIEGYVRGGLNKTWAQPTGDTDSDLDMSGRGMNLGLGAQYRFGLVPGWDAAVYVDYNHQSLELTDPGRPSMDTQGSIETLTLGFTVGTLL